MSTVQHCNWLKFVFEEERNGLDKTDDKCESVVDRESRTSFSYRNDISLLIIH